MHMKAFRTGPWQACVQRKHADSLSLILCPGRPGGAELGSPVILNFVFLQIHRLLFTKISCVVFFFVCLFKKIDVTNKAVAEILSKVTEYLQPNPGKVRKCL